MAELTASFPFWKGKQIMKFYDFGKKNLPVFVLLHGGGLSWWSFQNIIDELQDQYHLVVPVINGHGEEGKTEFVSIEDSADKLIAYLDANFGGRVFAIGGLSLGAQITVEVLSRREDIAEFAVIESALCHPMKSIPIFAKPMFHLFYGLIRQKWFSFLQAKSLGIPEEMFESYYHDSLKISKQSLTHLSVSNSLYDCKPGLKNSRAKALIIVGSKEPVPVKESSQKLHGILPESQLYLAQGMKHGELSLSHPIQYISLVSDFFEEQKESRQ